MGACVVKKQKQPKHPKPEQNNERRQIIDLETQQFGNVYDKKTARAYNKQSYEQIKQFLEVQPNSNDIQATGTTKDPDSQMIFTEKKIQNIQLENMSSFCQSVKNEFQQFQSLSDWEKEQTYHFVKFQVDKMENEEEKLDKTAETQMQKTIQINETPPFLRKYLPMQELSIEIKYL